MRAPGGRSIVAAVAAATVLLPVALAFACVGLASLVVEGSSEVEPGGTVTVTGRSFARGVPVDIRLDSLTAPVLVTVEGPGSTMNSIFTVDVPIPADISDGLHILLASQDHHDMNVGQPARAAIYVNAAPPPPPAPEQRPEGLVASTGPGALVLGLLFAGVAAAGLLVAGLGSRVRARGGIA